MSCAKATALIIATALASRTVRLAMAGVVISVPKISACRSVLSVGSRVTLRCQIQPIIGISRHIGHAQFPVRPVPTVANRSRCRIANTTRLMTHVGVINVHAEKIQENWVFVPIFPILQGKKF